MTAVDPRTWGERGTSGLRRFLPILRSLSAYDRSLIRFDVIAGVTV